MSDAKEKYCGDSRITKVLLPAVAVFVVVTVSRAHGQSELRLQVAPRT
jgi:hypothetical protein